MGSHGYVNRKGAREAGNNKNGDFFYSEPKEPEIMSLKTTKQKSTKVKSVVNVSSVLLIIRLMETSQANHLLAYMFLDSLYRCKSFSES